MTLRSVLAFGLTLALFGCATAELPPAESPPGTNVATPAPAPPPDLKSPPSSEPCPADVQAAAGKACSSEGEGCGDPARPGFGVVCRSGTWQAGEIPHPPCCKK